MSFRKNRAQLLVGVSIMATGLLLALVIFISQVVGMLPTPALVIVALALGSVAGPLIALLSSVRHVPDKSGPTQAL